MTARTFVACGVAPVILLAMVAATRPEAVRPAGSPGPADSRGALQGALPEGPRESVDADTIPEPKRRIQVSASGDLQRALDQAQPGDQIELENGATYQGPFRLRDKQGDGWIVVTSADPRGLPAPGERVSPSHAPRMAKLRASHGAVIAADAGAHHYRFIGLEIAPSAGTWLTALVQLGDDEADARRLPHHIVLDRCYLHGDPAKGSRRGVAMNSGHSAVIDSHLADFKEAGADSQAIAGWNGVGPFTIANNYLEAAGENVMFGGADPSIRGLVPADIRVTANHMAKPLRWRRGHPDAESTPWTVKNLFELKNARRVLVDGNLFEHNWPDGQDGFAILLTVRNQSGSAPWSVVEDVVFANNLVRHAGAGINILGRDDNQPSEQTRRIAIRGNLFVDIGGRWGSGRLFQLLDGTRDISISHNTAFQTGSVVVGGDHAPHAGFIFESNIALHNQYGISGSGTGTGQPTLDRYFPGAVVRRNVLIGGDAASYPRDNFFPATLEKAGFLKGPDGSYRVARRDGRAGREGPDIGADMESLMIAMSRVSGGHRALTGRSWQGPEAVQLAGLAGGSTRSRSGALAFWASLCLLAYVYAGYPLVAWLRSRLRPRLRVQAPAEPTVSIIVAAHNEGERIEARIENLLALDYPPGRREILIGSDGSTDGTASRASRYEDAGVRVEAFAEWRGKPAVLNDLVRRSTAEIVLFADARQRFDRGALRTLVSHFADPSVGAVSGELMLVDGTGTSIGRGTSFYWRYEKFIRLHEGRAASTVGATGAIYAIRRALFQPIPHDTILDDVLIPLRIVRQGYSVQFEPAARAFDAVSTTARQEYARKLRTIAGTFQLFARERWLCNPLKNPLWFETISHKGLRLTLPVLHATALVANLALTDGVVYLGLLAGQVGFYAAALAGHVFRHARRRPMFLTVPYAMCLMIWATLAGFTRFLAHRQLVTWEQSAPSVIPASSSSAR
ncbi:MAG TPA: glycosyltransferase family 2 protein [Vicinamibacterales bacterium]|nr:glycosyltransferase family 2 protein [Vicinamibacterales bacterium]